MIHLTNITKQHDSRILFQNVGLQVLPNSRTVFLAQETAEMRIFAGDYQYYLSKSGQESRAA